MNEKVAEWIAVEKAQWEIVVPVKITHI